MLPDGVKNKFEIILRCFFFFLLQFLDHLKIREIDNGLSAQKIHSLHNVPELPDVSRPVIIQQGVQGGVIKNLMGTILFIQLV